MEKKDIIILILCLFIIIGVSPYIKIGYFGGCSMYPEINYHSIDLMLSTDLIGYKKDDIVIYNGLLGSKTEHKIIGRCGYNNESYLISGNTFEDRKGIYHIGIKECVHPKDIEFKRIGGIDWKEC